MFGALTLSERESECVRLVRTHVEVVESSWLEVSYRRDEEERARAGHAAGRDSGRDSRRDVSPLSTIGGCEPPAELTDPI